MTRLHVPANESLDEAFRLWLELDRVAEAHGHEDEAANERADNAYRQYQVAQKADALDAIAAGLGKRIVAIGNANGLTAVDADWLADQDDMDATQAAASGRWGY